MTQPTWRTSSYTSGGNNCVEIATVGDNALLRDSKHPEAGYLTFPSSELAALVAAARAGELDYLS
jgi:hypothetical protein